MISELSRQLSVATVNLQPLLAQLPPPDSYHAVGWIILAVGGIAVVALTILQIVKTSRDLRAANDPQSVRVTNPTQKREITFPPEFPTVAECRELHTRVDRELTSIRADIIARDEASKQSRKGIHDQLNRVEKDIATLTERSEGQGEWLKDISGKLSEVAEGLANVAGRIK